MFQVIYVKALDEPAIGYAASPKFQRAMFDCPKCGAWAWIRLRDGKRVALGATCSKCPWLTTYLVKGKLPPAPVQTSLPLGPKLAAPPQERPPA